MYVHTHIYINKQISPTFNCVTRVEISPMVLTIKYQGRNLSHGMDHQIPRELPKFSWTLQLLETKLLETRRIFDG